MKKMMAMKTQTRRAFLKAFQPHAREKSVQSARAGADVVVDAVTTAGVKKQKRRREAREARDAREARGERGGGGTDENQPSQQTDFEKREYLQADGYFSDR